MKILKNLNYKTIIKKVNHLIISQCDFSVMTCSESWVINNFKVLKVFCFSGLEVKILQQHAKYEKFLSYRTFSKSSKKGNKNEKVYLW